MARYRCICGETFPTQRYLTEHIGIQNPRWPRKSPDDQHREFGTPANLTQSDFESIEMARRSYGDY